MNDSEKYNLILNILEVLMEKIEIISDYIEESYKNCDFDSNFFEFYKTRTEKKKNSIGILKLTNKKYFFKIVKSNEYNDEHEIKNRIAPYFRIVKKYSERKIGDEILNVYEYIDAPMLNAFNFLRDKNISLEQKETKLKDFFTKKIELMNKTCVLNEMTNDRKSDRWFYQRIKKSSRFDNFYGTNGDKLLEDIRIIYNKGYLSYKKFIKNVFDYIKINNKTIESYCHGDFHDFNFSLDGLFWDTDTFGMNPIMNDFAVYYWHFYGREDSFVYKYSPWLTNYMYDSLTKKQLDEVRKLKQKYIAQWYDAIEKLYKKHNILHCINDEFVFKLFCRMFLISNILEYEESDRKIVYEFFDYYLQNKDNPIKNLLFTNPIIIPYGNNK